jgi:hypothetical protein
MNRYYVLLATLVAVAAIFNAEAEIQAQPAEAFETDVQRLEGTWLLFRVVMQGDEFDLIGSGRPIATAIFDAGACRIDLGGKELSLRVEMKPLKHAADSVHWWGTLDVTLQGLLSCPGWYLYQPPDPETGAEYLSLNLGPPFEPRIDKFDVPDMQFIMVRTAESRMIDELVRRPLAATERNEPDTDLDRMQGRWKLESVNGQPVQEDIVHEIRKRYFELKGIA